MPKMRTHKGTAKRFRLTGTGKIKRANAFKSHILEKKSPKRKRAFKAASLVHASDVKTIKKNLGIG
ncbi:MAG: 50S ribosomal protein L35 [Actinomycetota bacterium]|jgi:large subunit ribosomal protein L35|nr:MAG: large subunit ribosomal protein [Actinomycetota bacterium]MDO8950751.1 50S ribosomal protein L35 [Actinomycetota bacterium]MDP3631020.1 50S ribosomal protein L35 [Actinomycetota bacterium]